jgi:hypothetical protein
MDRNDNSQDGNWSAVPDVYTGAEARSGPVLFTIEADGEVFALRRAADGSWTYEWLSGPNEGYGFSLSGPPIRSPEVHREHIRAFLSMIDPATGYIGDD